MPVVTFKVYPPEFRWGEVPVSEVGRAWFIRPLTAGATISYNTTTLRFIALCTPTLGAQSTVLAVSFCAPRTFTIRKLWILLAAANGATASAGFSLNIDGATQADVLTLGPTIAKAGLDLNVRVPIDSRLALECVSSVNSPEAIRAIGVSWVEAPGSDIA